MSIQYSNQTDMVNPLSPTGTDCTVRVLMTAVSVLYTPARCLSV